jgi:Queuosine biosynthesis protein QueC
MKQLPRFGRTGIVRVVERQVPPVLGVKTLVVDEEVGVDARLLLHYCYSQPNPFTYDLMTVVAAARAADREFSRVHSEAWARKLTVEVPVYDVELWRSSKTQALLTQTLCYLTGDEWEFDFKARRRRFKPPQEPPLRLTNVTKSRFLPYSHGLDSFAQLSLLQARDPDVQHVCVYADTRLMLGGWKEFCRRSKGQSVKALRVPLKFDDPHHAERTFRTRPFVYYTLTAYGAMTAGCSDVVIPENGQGSIGGSLAPLGSEAPHRSCHPGFTSRLSKLLQHLSGHSIQFQHPALFSTKGDVLRALADIKGGDFRWMPEHWSCSHDQRNSTNGSKRIHCGVCGNCILRRNAAVAANINDETTYLYQDFTRATMDASLKEGVPRPRSYKAFDDLASNGARSMQRLADLAADPESIAVWTEAANIAEAMGLPVSQTHSDLAAFLTRHAQQWEDFLNHCGEDSWLTAMARG